MGTIRVRANVPVLGLAAGDETEVEQTDLIRGAVKNGYLTDLSTAPSAEQGWPAAEAENLENLAIAATSADEPERPEKRRRKSTAGTGGDGGGASPDQ